MWIKLILIAYKPASINNEDPHLKSTIPSFPEGAFHFVVMLWKSIFAELL